jgi:hypothetical protein
MTLMSPPEYGRYHDLVTAFYTGKVHSWWVIACAKGRVLRVKINYELGIISKKRSEQHVAFSYYWPVFSAAKTGGCALQMISCGYFCPIRSGSW